MTRPRPSGGWPTPSSPRPRPTGPGSRSPNGTWKLPGRVAKASKGVDLAETGYDQIREVELHGRRQEGNGQGRPDRRWTRPSTSSTSRRSAPRSPAWWSSATATWATSPRPAWRMLSMYNPDLLYVTANLEETRLRGVAPGNPVELQLDAFAEPFRGRVVWINKSTGAQFALMPRNVVSGEFTKVVQRVPVRIWIEKDERWPLLRAGLSVTVPSPTARATPSGPSRPPGRWRTSRCVTTSRSPRTCGGRTGGPAMTATLPTAHRPRCRTCACVAGPAAAARAPPLAGGPGDPRRLLRALPDPRADRHHRRRRAERPRHR